jgi:biotin synthase
MIGIGPFIPHPATPLGSVRGSLAESGGPPDSRPTDLAAAADTGFEGTTCSAGRRTPHAGGVCSPNQIPNTELMVYKAVALTRLVRPDANIPSTSALATINKRNGRELGLQRGANVFMPNLTPLAYRRLYEIYPAKACIAETGDQCHGCLRARIARLGRHVGQGPGGRPRAGAGGARPTGMSSRTNL